MNTENIKQRIVERLSLSYLPTEARESLSSALLENIVQEIVVQAHDRLTEEDRVVYKELVSKENGEGVFLFLSEKIPEFTELAHKAVETTLVAHEQ